MTERVKTRARHDAGGHDEDSHVDLRVSPVLRRPATSPRGVLAGDADCEAELNYLLAFTSVGTTSSNNAYQALSRTFVRREPGRCEGGRRILPGLAQWSSMGVSESSPSTTVTRQPTGGKMHTL